MIPLVKRPPFLALFLSILHLHHFHPAFAVQINTIQPECVAAPRVRLVSEPVKCPCFIRVQMEHPTSTHPDSALRLDYLAVRASEYNEGTPWEELHLLRYENASEIEATTNSGGVYNSGDKEVKDHDEYVFLIRTRPAPRATSKKDKKKSDCSTTIRYVFESVPEPCPASTTTTLKTTGNAARNSSGTKLERKKGPPNYIVGGRVVEESDRVVQSAAVILTKFGDCSAVAVAQHYILTAAHCRVRVGTIIRVGGRSTEDMIYGTNHMVERIWVHPDFRTHTVSGLQIADIAMLRVVEPILGIAPENVMHINANEENGRVENQLVEASGYGRIAEGWSGDMDKARNLKTVQLQVIDEEECKGAFEFGGAPRVAQGITDYSHICAGIRQRTCSADTCTGDSGGPLIAINDDGDRRKNSKLTLVAITSGGLGCGRIGIPGIYTRISTYAEWISEVTQGEVKVSYDKAPTAPRRNVGEKEGARGSGHLEPWPWLVAAIAASAGVLVLALTLVLFFVCYRGDNKVQTEFNGVARDRADGESEGGENEELEGTTNGRWTEEKENEV